MKYPIFICAVTASVGMLTASAALAQTAPEPAASASPAATVAPAAPTESHAVTAKPRDLQPPHDRNSSPKVLEKYDTNKNGVIDPDEKEAMKKDRVAKREERLKKYDKNGDGKLDDTEKAAMKADLKAEHKENKGK